MITSAGFDWNHPAWTAAYVGEPGAGVSALRKAVIEATGYEARGRDFCGMPFSSPPWFDGAMELMWSARDSGAVFVIPAPTGVTAPTRALVELAYRIGVADVAVFVSKTDLVPDPELHAVVELEVRGLLDDCGYPAGAVPVVFGSALTPEQGCVEALLSAVEATFATRRNRAAEPFLMPAEDVFGLPCGRTVMTGRVERGTVRIGDELELVGGGPVRTVTVTAMEKFRVSVGRAEAGENVGLRLRGIEGCDDAERGQVLTMPGSVGAYREFEAWVRIRPEEAVGRAITFPSTREGRFLFRAMDVHGEILTLEGDGGPGLATLTARLPAPVPLEPGLRFTMRDRTGSGVADGVVTRVGE
ncbi:EF-Tu/IF-2/RF-3 family GTPase [Streptomyces syringium]|uniref:EF-Tu/IF-2/RF-3 family GTPase n=1 Tax=Streptomyces syringium TaxID=76729 RepID=UPI003402B285